MSTLAIIIVSLILLSLVVVCVMCDSEGFHGRRIPRGRLGWRGYPRYPAFVPVGTYTPPVYISDVAVPGASCVLKEDLNDPFGRHGIYRYYCN